MTSPDSSFAPVIIAAATRGICHTDIKITSFYRTCWNYWCCLSFGRTVCRFNVLKVQFLHQNQGKALDTVWMLHFLWIVLGIFTTGHGAFSFRLMFFFSFSRTIKPLIIFENKRLIKKYIYHQSLEGKIPIARSQTPKFPLEIASYKTVTTKCLAFWFCKNSFHNCDETRQMVCYHYYF